MTIDAAAARVLPRDRPPAGGPDAREALAWRRPCLYELYFALAPAASRLRRRELAAVLEHVDSAGGPRERVLEVGPGPGTYTRHLADRFREVVAVDAASAMLARLARNMDRERIDNVSPRWGRLPGLELPGEAPFDAVVAAGVLDYLPNLVGALRALSAHLRPGAWMVVTLPAARRGPRPASLLEGTLVQRSHPRRAPEVALEASRAGLRLDERTDVALGGIRRTLVVRATAVRPA